MASVSHQILIGSGGAAAATGILDVLGANARAWYQMDLLTGSNGDNKSPISDSSGNGFDLTQATSGLRGTLAAADLDGKNTLRFTASSSQRYPFSSSVFGAASAGSMYLVYKVVSEAANNGFMDLGTSASSSHWPFSDGVQYNDFGSTVRKTVGNPTVSLTSTYRIISIVSAASSWKFFIDGGAGGSSGGTTAFFSTGTNTVGWSGSGIQFGANAALTAFLDGWVAEAIFSNAAQSDANRQKIEGILAHKWGLETELDSAHPYKSAPP